jgi:hypothetical protein
MKLIWDDDLELQPDVISEQPVIKSSYFGKQASPTSNVSLYSAKFEGRAVIVRHYHHGDGEEDLRKDLARLGLLKKFWYVLYRWAHRHCVHIMRHERHPNVQSLIGRSHTLCPRRFLVVQSGQNGLALRCFVANVTQGCQVPWIT